jgi:hypothetical protein
MERFGEFLDITWCCITAIMVLYYGGPREGHWLQEANANYEDAVFASQYIGQYWAGLSSIRKIDAVLHPPSYGDNTDPFDPIRHR